MYTIKQILPNHRHEVLCACFLHPFRNLFCAQCFLLGKLYCNLEVTSQLATYLHAFISNTAAALSSVTHLVITIPPASDSAYRDPHYKAAVHERFAMLSLLANACPHLQHLTLDEASNLDLLMHFGINCHKLTHLEADFVDVSWCIKDNSFAPLPHLTSFSSLASSQPFYSTSAYQSHFREQQQISSACKFLQACPSLLNLNLEHVPMTPNIWKALSPCLLSLSFACFINRQHETWEVHARLQKLELGKQEMPNIKELAALLAAAPRLTHLHLAGEEGVEAGIFLKDALALQAVDDLVCSGQLGITQQGTKACDRQVRLYASANKIRLQFWIRGESCTASSDSSIDTDGSQVNGLTLFWQQMKPVTSFAIVGFKFGTHPFDEHVDKAVHLHDLPRVFPNVEELSITDLVISESDLLSLVGCSLLHALTLTKVHSLCHQDVQALCQASTSLTIVRLIGCTGCTMETHTDNKEQLETLGMHVRVLHSD